MMKKAAIGFIIFLWITRIASLAFLLLLVAGALVFATGPDEAPDIEKAPWGIQTYTDDVPSRVYYAEDVRLEGNMPIIKGYWSFNGKKFKFNKGEKEFPQSDYSFVQVVDRRIVR